MVSTYNQTIVTVQVTWRYCWCKKSQTTAWDVLNLENNGINYQPQVVSRISSISSSSGYSLPAFHMSWRCSVCYFHMKLSTQQPWTFVATKIKSLILFILDIAYFEVSTSYFFTWFSVLQGLGVCLVYTLGYPPSQQSSARLWNMLSKESQPKPSCATITDYWKRLVLWLQQLWLSV